MPSSPCRKVCIFDDEVGRCTTCGRTLEDISKWSSMTEKERRKRMTELQQEYPEEDTE